MNEAAALAVALINKMGYDNTQWNIELKDVPEAIYGNPCDEDCWLKPHVALYEQDNVSLDEAVAYACADTITDDGEGHKIYIYYL